MMGTPLMRNGNLTRQTRAKRKEKNERAEKEKERKRAARKVVKDLNKVGFKALVAQAPADDDEDTDDPNQFLPREVEV